MKRYDFSYSAYYGDPCADYPEGSAVDSTSEDCLDGTPLRADFFNDVVGFFQAAFHKAFGNPFEGASSREVSNEPETARKSDVLDALCSIADGKVGEEREGREKADADEAAAREEADAGIRARLDGILDLVYPVGSLYWSSKSTDPAELFGGTWKPIADRFVLAAGDEYRAGAFGGAAARTLTVEEMPSHRHGGSTGGSGARTDSALGTVTVSNFWVRDRFLETTDPGLAEVSTRHLGNVGCEYGGGDNQGTVTLKMGHSHALSSHSHTIPSEGGGKAFSIMPPYVVRYCWERTA